MEKVAGLISFVIPCYRSELTIEKVVNEIIDVVSQRPAYDYEILCVNDCSPDNVYEVLKKLAGNNEKIKVINLASNMGKASAMMAGFSFVRGEYVVNLDDDCQCPLGELWSLLNPIENDECDVATASYTEKKQAKWKNIGSDINMFMGILLLDKPKNLRMENFFVMKRFVLDEIVKYPYPYTYMEGLILRVTKRIMMVPMEERERGDDKPTGFTFKKSLALWLNGFTAFSVKPLRISSFVGILSAAVGFIWGLVSIIKKIVNPDVPMGYTSIVVILLLVGGLILLSLGLIGEYIGRIYICINKSPQYVIRDTVNVKK